MEASTIVVVFMTLVTAGLLVGLEFKLRRQKRQVRSTDEQAE